MRGRHIERSGSKTFAGKASNGHAICNIHTVYLLPGVLNSLGYRLGCVAHFILYRWMPFSSIWNLEFENTGSSKKKPRRSLYLSLHFDGALRGFKLCFVKKTPRAIFRGCEFVLNFSWNRPLNATSIVVFV